MFDGGSAPSHTQSRHRHSIHGGSDNTLALTPPLSDRTTARTRPPRPSSLRAASLSPRSCARNCACSPSATARTPRAWPLRTTNIKKEELLSE
eukprot:1186836-Prorocentrum_minimum.AAC.1